MKTVVSIKILLIFFVLSDISFTQEDSTWIELNYPPESPRCQTVTNSYNHIFVGGGSGIWRTTDDGELWESVLSTSRIWTIYKSYDGKMYCGTESNGMFFSADSGATWQQLQVPGNKVTSVAVSPVDGYIYVVTNGIHKSTDNGQTWNQIVSTTESDNVFVDQFNNLFAWFEDSYQFVSSFHRSGDGGETWTEFDFISTSSDILSRKLFTTQLGYFYFMCYTEFVGQNGYIKISTDHGETWVNYSTCTMASFCRIDDVNRVDHVITTYCTGGGFPMCAISLNTEYFLHQVL